MKLQEVEAAAAVLGIPSLEGLTEEALSDAFREKARAIHPDGVFRQKGSMQEMAEQAAITVSLARVQEARDTLRAWLNEQPDPNCKFCRGTGFVGSGGFSASVPCSKCSR